MEKMALIAMTERRNRIKELLSARGRSIYGLANEVGMSYQAIHRLVNARRIPGGTSYSTLRKIADALGVGVDDLEALE